MSRAADGREFPVERLLALPAPSLPRLGATYDVLVTGVGGTGVITVGALITMAAHLEGKGASVLDFMGFAQKFGPVLSYIRIAANPGQLNQVRIDDQRADALIGCDLVVSSSAKASRTYRAKHTRAVINTTEMSTADFVLHRDASLRADTRLRAIESVVGQDRLSAVAANELAERLLGNTIYANVLLLGFAWQKGLLPVSREALVRAIELNGVEVENNLRAFGWGRLAAADPAHVASSIGAQDADGIVEDSLDELIERRRAFLVDYQDEKLAHRYLALTRRAREAEMAADPGGSLGFTETVAKAYFKTLAYKDEYEVGRLHAGSGFLDRIRNRYGRGAKIRFHLAPPLLSTQLDHRGHPVKREFGAWMIPVFRLLASLRRLRGSRLDLFGMTAERRMERSLIREFEQAVEQLIANLSAENIAEAARIAGLFLDIRGYGPVKLKAVEDVREQLRTALADYLNVTRQAA